MNKKTQRSELIKARVTPEEKQQIEDHALYSALSVSDYIRNRVLKKSIRYEGDTILRNEIRALYRLIDNQPQDNPALKDSIKTLLNALRQRAQQ